MAYPCCPNPAHVNGKVVRAGWYGTKPHRRQRWLCKPANGDPWHRFSEELPRQERPRGVEHCPDCSSALDDWQGQAAARRYAYNARDVAYALKLVSDGVSYRRAAQSVHIGAGRTAAGVTWGPPDEPGAPVRKRRLRQRALDGQLVANWVDVFAHVVTSSRLPSAWPQRLVVDSAEFHVGVGRSLHLMVAVGFDPPNLRSPRAWRMRPYPDKSQESWEDFFGQLPGTPERIVADMDTAIMNAIGTSFPRGEDPAPVFHWSDVHVKRALHNALAPLHPQPDHPVMRQLDEALQSLKNWDAFVAAIHAENATGIALPAAERWLRDRGRLIRAQAAQRDSGPYSTGAVEGINRKLRTQLIGDRAKHLGNRARTIDLLDLLTLGLNGRAHERAFADDVRAHLKAHHGRPASGQRPRDDKRGQPSLWS